MKSIEPKPPSGVRLVAGHPFPFHETAEDAQRYHESLRTAADGSWEVLPLPADGRMGDVQRSVSRGVRFAAYDLQLRNCPCGSTISRRIPATDDLPVFDKTLSGQVNRE
jgi:hypothetical protein